MAIQQEIRLRVGGRLRYIPAFLGITVAFFAFWGMWQISPEPMLTQQDQLLRVRNGDSLIFDLDFANTSSGNLQNEGVLTFLGNITNYGKMGCGSCKSGKVYLKTSNQKDIYIRGTHPILIYEASFEGVGNVFLENEVQLTHHIKIDSAGLLTSYHTDVAYLHFLPNASYTLSEDKPYIESWIGRTGQGMFCYPLGGDGEAKYIYLQGKFEKSFYKAIYLPKNQVENPLFQKLCQATEFECIADIGIWKIEGKEATSITFATGKAEGEAIIVGYFKGQWHQIGTTKSTHGLSTEKAIIPDMYEAFSLAKVSDR